MCSVLMSLCRNVVMLVLVIRWVVVGMLRK